MQMIIDSKMCGSDHIIDHQRMMSISTCSPIMSESQYHDEMRMNYVLVVVFSYEEEQSYQQLKLHEFLNSPDQQKCFIPARRARFHFFSFSNHRGKFCDFSPVSAALRYPGAGYEIPEYRIPEINLCFWSKRPIQNGKLIVYPV